MSASWLVKACVGLGVAGALGGAALAAHFGLQSEPSRSPAVSGPSPSSASAPSSTEPSAEPSTGPSTGPSGKPSVLPSSPTSRPSVGLSTSPSGKALAVPSTPAPARPAPPNPGSLPVGPNTAG